MRFAATFLATTLLSLLPGRATVLLNDTFANGNRDTQSLPSSAALYHGGTNANQSLDVESQALEFNFHTTANQLGQFVGYFTNSGGVSLGVGESLSLSLTLSASAITTQGNSLRIGMFHSGGERVNADTTGIADSAFNEYSGYSFWNSVGTGTANGGFRQRTGANDTLWASGANTNLGSQNLARLGYSADTAYTLTFSLARISATEMTVTFTDSANNSYSRTDSADIFTSFDTFSVFLDNGSVSAVDYTFDNIVVTYNAIPEPTAAALMIPALAGIFFRRSRGK